LTVSYNADYALKMQDWVLFPITLVMVSRHSELPVRTPVSNHSIPLQILVGLLRHYVTLLLNSAPKKQPEVVVREQ
jgi:hypothetical protein